MELFSHVIDLCRKRATKLTLAVSQGLHSLVYGRHVLLMLLQACEQKMTDSILT